MLDKEVVQDPDYQNPRLTWNPWKAIFNSFKELEVDPVFQKMQELRVRSGLDQIKVSAPIPPDVQGIKWTLFGERWHHLKLYNFPHLMSDMQPKIISHNRLELLDMGFINIINVFQLMSNIKDFFLFLKN